MAKLFGYPINVEAEGGGGSAGGSANAEASRSGISAGLPQREESNPHSRFPESGSSAPMDPQSDLDNSFIDFFGRESNEIETVGESRNQRRRITPREVDIRGDVTEEMELGLGIGAASGDDSVTVNKVTDPGRVVVGGTDLTPLGGSMGLAPFDDDLFCEEEAMLMMTDQLELEPVQSRTAPVNNIDALEYAEAVLMNAVEGSSIMDVDAEFFLAMFPRRGGEETRGAYADVFAEPFDQELPPPLPRIVGTRPASKRVVDDLPVVEITSEELSKGKIVCAVCTGEVAVGEKVTRLPCWHYYHGECIVPWLGVKNTCPVCRFELPTDERKG